MKKIINIKLKAWVTAILCVLSIGSSAGTTPIHAHGGEDHGDQKPKTETSAKGGVIRTTRLGDFEVTMKHPTLGPDAAAQGSLFVTRFATNEPVDAGNVQVAFEGQNGSVSNVTVEKSAVGGSYALDFPAMTDGEYTLRVTLTAGGKTSTATFSDVEVHSVAAATGIASSWSGFLLTALFLIVGIALFAGLVYLAVTVAGRRTLGEEAVSA